mmetsp:Transcript_14151/g.50871  ORF Transcript_14151/g.50871 Transcript_14151/m.50871 type:complete len:241 (-) Transcript_14151:2471-3193(-)
MTNTLSKNASDGSTSSAAALSKSSTLAVDLSPIFAAAFSYASHSAVSSSSAKLSLFTSKSSGSSLPRTRRVGRASTAIAALSSSPPTNVSSALAVVAASAGSPPRSASAARTTSAPQPSSTRNCSRRRVTYSRHSVTTSSPHVTGCSAAASFSAARRSHRTFDDTSACTAPYAARRSPNGSAVALGAPTTAKRPTSVSNLSATATATPALDVGRRSPDDLGSAASKIASHRGAGRPSLVA